MSEGSDELISRPDLAPFAAALRQLAPQPPHMSREALLFAAGKAAAAPRIPVWVWPTLTGTFAATSLVLGAFLLSPPALHHPPEVHPQHFEATLPVVIENNPEPPPPQVLPKTTGDEPSEIAKSRRVRQDVLRWGVEMLPPSPSMPQQEATPEVTANDYRRWVNGPTGTFAMPALPPKKPLLPEDEP